MASRDLESLRAELAIAGYSLGPAHSEDRIFEAVPKFRMGFWFYSFADQLGVPTDIQKHGAKVCGWTDCCQKTHCTRAEGIPAFRSGQDESKASFHLVEHFLQIRLISHGYLENTRT